MSRVLNLKPSYYEALKRLTLELAGVNLGGDHRFLIETRLSALARQEGYESLQDLIEILFSEGHARLALRVVSALLERDTHFNADPKCMSVLQAHILPSIHETFKDQPLRILSFGCNSGQEAYSVAIKVDKLKQALSGTQIDIIGIDYPSPALDRAQKGQYTHFEVQRGLPIKDLVKYFDRRGEDWIVKPELKSSVSFQEYHLLSNLDELGKFHLVIFRNSLPYYSSTAQIRVLRSLSNIVMDRGYLLVGSDETFPKINYGFDPVVDMPGAWRKQAIDADIPVDDGISAIQEQIQEKATLG